MLDRFHTGSPWCISYIRCNLPSIFLYALAGNIATQHARYPEPGALLLRAVPVSRNAAPPNSRVGSWTAILAASLSRADGEREGEHGLGGGVGEGEVAVKPGLPVAVAVVEQFNGLAAGPGKGEVEARGAEDGLEGGGIARV